MGVKELRETALRYMRKDLGWPKAEVLDHVWDPHVEGVGLVLLRTKAHKKDVRLTLLVKDYEVISEASPQDFYRNAPWWKRVDRVWVNSKMEEPKSDPSYTCDTCGNTTLRKPLPTGRVYCPSCRDTYPNELRSRHER